jgi:hypothetical protein
MLFGLNDLLVAFEHLGLDHCAHHFPHLGILYHLDHLAAELKVPGVVLREIEHAVRFIETVIGIERKA